MSVLAESRPFAGCAAVIALAMLVVGCSEEPTSPPPVAPPVHRTATVVVWDSLQTPLVSARVTLLGPDSAGTPRQVSMDTDAQGLATTVLHDGDWSAYAADTGLDRVAGATFVVPGAAALVTDTVLVRLAVHTASAARGRVLLAGRIDHSGTSVSVPRLPLPAFTTGPTGAYRLDDLPLGRWKLQMLALGFQVGLVDVVVSAPGETVDVPDVQLISSP